MKKQRKEPAGPHHEAARAFCGAWQACYGDEYPCNAGKDTAAVKWMLDQFGGDPAKFAPVGRRTGPGPADREGQDGDLQALKRPDDRAGKRP